VGTGSVILAYGAGLEGRSSAGGDGDIDLDLGRLAGVQCPQRAPHCRWLAACRWRAVIGAAQVAGADGVGGPGGIRTALGVELPGEVDEDVDPLEVGAEIVLGDVRLEPGDLGPHRIAATYLR
jgi:hypothetical protein